MATLNDEESGCIGEPHQGLAPELRPAEEKTCARAAGIFRALGDLSRLRLLSLLANRGGGDRCQAPVADLHMNIHKNERDLKKKTSTLDETLKCCILHRRSIIRLID